MMIFKRMLALLASVFLLACGLTNNGMAAGYLGEPRADYRVLFLGDKLGGGLWAGAARVGKGDQRLRIDGRYKEDSSLTWVQNYNWAEALPTIIESKKPDIAVVMIGMNDSRDIRANNQIVPFGSDEWKEIYKSRVEQVITVLQQHNLAVYWVELPPMRDAGYNAQLRVVAQVQEQAVIEAKLRYLSIQQRFTDDSGNYTENGTGIDGRVTRLRARNGVTFIKPGNDKLASILFKVIHKDIDIADGELQPDEAPVLSTAKDERNVQPALDDYVGPMIGQAGVSRDAEPIFYRPKGLAMDNGLQVARMPAAVDHRDAKKVLQNLAKTAAKGSAAEILFSTGNWPVPPAGRLDDFNDAKTASTQ